MAWRLSVQFGDSVIEKDFASKNAALSALATVESNGYTVIDGDMSRKYYPASIMSVKLEPAPEEQ